MSFRAHALRHAIVCYSLVAIEGCVGSASDVVDDFRDETGERISFQDCGDVFAGSELESSCFVSADASCSAAEVHVRETCETFRDIGSSTTCNESWHFVFPNDDGLCERHRFSHSTGEHEGLFCSSSSESITQTRCIEEQCEQVDHIEL